MEEVTKTLNLSCLAANQSAQLPWWIVWRINMCHGVKQKAFYNLPEGQAALVQKFSAGQAERLGHCHIPVCSRGSKARVSGDHCLQTTVSMDPVALQVSPYPSPWGYFSSYLCFGIFSDPAGIEKQECPSCPNPAWQEAPQHKETNRATNH